MTETATLQTTELRVRCYRNGKVNWQNRIIQCTVPLCDCSNEKKMSLMGAKTEGWHPAVEDITIKIDSSRRLEKGKEKYVKTTLKPFLIYFYKDLLPYRH